ncbi:type IV secretion system protein [Arthrobacter sp. UKPF54-2]|uniref:type IV secretion system protein n=1 Tax=Arthrobacter sp. UKPF54-2 TaxID=2600159 RepID=UPI0011B18E15|nr:type IV secretion system protein [Arthrobacter sp. UKPF54-2]QDY89113.1 type IV secretion system protein [Arthrobacter sp. UKPF54-2]
MSTFNSQGTAPADTPAPAAVPSAPTPVSKGNGWGVAALVLGIVAVVFSFIPVMGVVAFVLGPLAVLFGIIGVTRKLAKKGAAVAGVVLGILSIVIAAIWMAVLSAAVSSADQALNSEHKVEYVVTTNGKASVSYWTSGGSSNEDITTDWKKEQTVKNSDFVSLVVTGDYSNAAAVVGCKILFDGKSISKNSGTGQGAMASCSGSGLGANKK